MKKLSKSNEMEKLCNSIERNNWQMNIECKKCEKKEKKFNAFVRFGVHETHTRTHDAIDSGERRKEEENINSISKSNVLDKSKVEFITMVQSMQIKN